MPQFMAERHGFLCPAVGEIGVKCLERWGALDISNGETVPTCRRTRLAQKRLERGRRVPPGINGHCSTVRLESPKTAHVNKARSCDGQAWREFHDAAIRWHCLGAVNGPHQPMAKQLP